MRGGRRPGCPGGLRVGAVTRRQAPTGAPPEGKERAPVAECRPSAAEVQIHSPPTSRGRPRPASRWAAAARTLPPSAVVGRPADLQPPPPAPARARGRATERRASRRPLCRCVRARRCARAWPPQAAAAAACCGEPNERRQLQPAGGRPAEGVWGRHWRVAPPQRPTGAVQTVPSRKSNAGGRATPRPRGGTSRPAAPPVRRPSYALYSTYIRAVGSPPAPAPAGGGRGRASFRQRRRAGDPPRRGGHRPCPSRHCGGGGGPPQPTRRRWSLWRPSPLGPPDG